MNRERKHPTAPVITVSAVVLRDESGRVLCVRKRGTSFFMFPGGKPEPGESAVTAAAREVREELGLVLAPDALMPLGRWETAAANEAGHGLVGEVFEVLRPLDRDAVSALAARAEIEELRWLDPGAEHSAAEVAPLTRECVFPVLAARRRG